MSNKSYIIGGLGCSGKTTFARKLASENNIPYFNADDIYKIIQEKLNVDPDILVNLPMEKFWDNPEKFGFKMVIYKTMAECVEQAYLELFSYNIPLNFVIEGEGIFYNHYEFDILSKLLENREKRYIAIMPDYEQWLKNRSRRILVDKTYTPKFRDQDEYYALCEDYKNYLPKQTIIIKDILNTECTLMGKTNYQKEEFSDPKWEVFNFPTDMSGKRFLDISCNTGWFSQKASKAGADVVGIDIAWPLLDVAYDRVPNGQFYLSKIEDFNLEGFYFDYVLCCSAFHYYTNREDIIRRISQVTKCFVLELPLLDKPGKDIIYQSNYVDNFCSLPTEDLIVSWLSKYFKRVEKIGYTKQPDSDDRPVFKCTN